MPGLSAVVFIPDDTAKTGYSRPMMLQNIMGTPLLSWLASSLIAGGVGRFFMVCHERFRRDVRACIPDDVGFFCPAQEAVSDQLHVFLSTADESEEDVIVVTGPAIILPYANDEEEFDSAPIVSPVTSVNRVTLMQALDEKFIFTEFLKDHGVPYTDRDGVYGVAEPERAARSGSRCSTSAISIVWPSRALKSGTTTILTLSRRRRRRRLSAPAGDDPARPHLHRLRLHHRPEQLPRECQDWRRHERQQLAGL